MSVPDLVDDASNLGLPSLGPKTPDPGGADQEPERPRGARRGDIIGGRYRVEGQIGRGGMGRVLQVRHCSLGKAFALKLPQRRTVTSPEVRDRFHREAKVASSLQHENICSVIDFGEDPRFGLFMVMELLEGVRLDYKLQRDGRLPPKVACDVITQVAEALRYVHNCGIIHGDIKSENILLTRSQDRRRLAKLLDFGLARPDDRRAADIEGTPEYMAPERIMRRPASPQSDIYALGILFWECLVGELPFRGPHELVFQNQLRASLPPPSSLLERPLEQRADLIIARATAKRPEDRHADMSAFLYELRTLGNMLGVDATRRRGVDMSQRFTTGSGGGQLARPPEPLLSAAGEVFENSPIPLASVDARGFVRVANRAFRSFLGHSDPTGILLSETALVNVYPHLLDDLQLVAGDGTTIKQLIEVPHRSGGYVVETVVMLTPAPETRLVTAGDIYVALHPLAPRAARGG
ncbi:MAG TPA: protein kinase [Kofleriaceae bacterium]|nr:protein kinase [Kofleriaceae bacterium]